MIIDAIENLNDAGIRAERGFPGKRLPELALPLVAVSVHRWEPETQCVTLRAVVMSPASLGGVECENTATSVCRVLGEMGGTCVQEGCENVSRTDLLSVRVTAVFRQEAEAQVRFSVYVERNLVAGADSFTAWRSNQEPETALQDAVWHFRLEAQDTCDAPETQIPLAPEYVQVSREERMETYTDCVLTSQRIETGYAGRRIIWEGTAQSRTVTTA